MTSTEIDFTKRNIILNHRGGRMADEGRRPGVPPDPQETTLRLTDKIIVNEDSHDAACQPRFLGRVPSPADGGGAVVTISSDLGTNFTSQSTQQFEKMVRCTPRFNSPLHPQAT